jgi:hypothetical protein
MLHFPGFAEAHNGSEGLAACCTFENILRLFQNPVGSEQALGKTGQSPVFPLNLWKLFQKLKFWNSFR